MKIIDIHAHLDFDDYKNDLDVLINKWKAAGVLAIINNGVKIESNRKTLELAKRFDIIKPALGIYPTHCVGMSDEEFDAELDFISKQKIIALGEIGLDYSTNDDNPFGDEKKHEMKRCFEKFISLAEKKNIPLIVHSRKAELDAVEMLESARTKKIIMHCFCGRRHIVKKIIDKGWYLSIPCNVVRNHQFQENVIMQDLSKLLTETDAPYLSPFPDIKRNEPSFILESLKKIAELKKLDVEEVANNIYKNYQDIFL